MKRIYYFTSLMCLLSIACQKEEIQVETHKSVSISLAIQPNVGLRLVDEDNLQIEQTIKNLSVFFTEPSSLTITQKYIFTGFTISGEYQVISLPLEPSDLLVKDIYVVANYDNETTLAGITTITQLQELHTPEIDKANNLNPANGFCMYGKLSNFDFVNATESPIVNIRRACAKLRISLSFPENSTLSTTNSFLIQTAAKYTYIVSNATTVLPISDYFNFASALPLVDNGSQAYTNIVYVYEAPQAPAITVYTHINNVAEEQQFTATLPVPVRNHLYDLQIYVYEEEATSLRNSAFGNSPTFRYEYRVNVYDETGILTNE